MSQTDTHASQAQRALALFATWIIMGLWHGANWTFGLWGFYHACLIQAQRWLGGVTKRLPAKLATLGGLAVTLPLSMAGWVPFRSATLGDSFAMWGRMFDLRGLFKPQFGLPPNAFILASLLVVGFFATWGWTAAAGDRVERRPNFAFACASAYYGVLIALSLLYLQVKAQFIYFQF